MDNGLSASQSLGVQLHPLSLPQYIERVQSVPEDLVHRDVEKVIALGLPLADVAQEALAVNSRYYLSMLDIMQEECLDALALQCWPELPNFLGQWPYLAISRLTAEGHPVSIEGDVDGSIISLLGICLGIGTGFLTDWLEHDSATIHFWHPGMAPMSMCHAVGSKDGPSLGFHFNIAKPLVLDGRLQPDQPITITRLWRCDDKYHLTAFQGRSIEPKRRITGNSLLVEVTDHDVPARFERLIHAGMPHHVSIFYGHHAEALRRLSRLLHLQWHN